MNKPLIALLLVAGLGCAVSVPTWAQTGPQTDSRQIPVADYTLFVDPPTGFVFVKLPRGWKFVGKIEPDDVARLPGNVVTALLKPDIEAAEADSSTQEATLGAQGLAGWRR